MGRSVNSWWEPPSGRLRGAEGGEVGRGKTVQQQRKRNLGFGDRARHPRAAGPPPQGQSPRDPRVLLRGGKLLSVRARPRCSGFAWVCARQTWEVRCSPEGVSLLRGLPGRVDRSPDPPHVYISSELC